MMQNPLKKAGLLKEKIAARKQSQQEPLSYDESLPDQSADQANTLKKVNNPFKADTPAQNFPEVVQRYGIPALQIGLVAAFLVFFLPNFQSSNPNSSASFESVLSALQEKTDAELFPAQSDQSLRRYFDIDASQYEDIVFLRQDDALSASEIVLVRFASNDDAQEFESKMQERINSQIQVYEGYAPEQAAMCKAAQIEVDGNYAVYICADNVSELLQSFDAAVEKGR
jgi:hypothetical protein